MQIVHKIQDRFRNYSNMPSSKGVASNFLITCNSDDERKLVEDFIDELQEAELKRRKNRECIGEYRRQDIECKLCEISVECSEKTEA